MLSHRLGFSSSPEWLERSSHAWRVRSVPSPAPAPASDKDHWPGEYDAPPCEQPDHLRRCKGRAQHRDSQTDRLRGSVGGDSRESIVTTYSCSRRGLAPRPDLARRRCWVCTDPIQAVTLSSHTGRLRSSGPLTFSPRSMRRGLARRRARVGARVALRMASAGRSTGRSGLVVVGHGCCACCGVAVQVLPRAANVPLTVSPTVGATAASRGAGALHGPVSIPPSRPI